MKKYSLLFPIILTLFSSVSCNNLNNKISVNQKEGIDSFILIDDRELINYINQKKDFMVVIGQQGCESCINIIPTFNEYIKNTSRIIYWIEISDYLLAEESLKNSGEYALNPMINTASLLFFDDGITIKNLEYSHSLYSSTSSLEREINKYTYNSKYFNLNDIVKTSYMGDYYMYKNSYSTYKLLNERVRDDQDITVLYTLNTCKDCQLLKQMFLDEYLVSKNYRLYYFEVDDIRNGNEDDWITFKSLFQFDNYRDGRVPTFVSYQEGKKINMAVFVNDVIEEKDNKFIITDSFWEEDVIGINGSTYEECYNKASKIEEKLIKSYLDYYL